VRKLKGMMCGFCEIGLAGGFCGVVDFGDELSKPCSVRVRYERARRAVRSDRRKGKRD